MPLVFPSEPWKVSDRPDYRAGDPSDSDDDDQNDDDDDDDCDVEDVHGENPPANFE